MRALLLAGNGDGWLLRTSLCNICLLPTCPVAPKEGLLALVALVEHKLGHGIICWPAVILAARLQLRVIQ